ncbi:exonuclease 3'-5' domain-containing protein 2-like [Ranitomeya variabilis]|uniref:exonuclease 3'-5' domain-containing protein 2-like n=1 Tax=Ranitomeya variabilis TaxID=490064 RepID=UPI004057AED0
MPRHAGITLGVASLVGTTVGCLVLWKLINRRRQQLCTNVDHKDLCTALAAEIHGSDQKVHQSLERERSVFSVEKLLQAPIKIVSKAEEWEAVWPSLQRDLDEYPVLGVDCEWVSVDGRANPISLLQMASHSGFCVLVRLPRLVSTSCNIPNTLVALLASSNVLKVGVGCWEDASKLMNEYGLSVKGIVDIRYLAMRHRRDIFQNSLSLKSLSETILCYPLAKSFQLRCSNWDAKEFTQDQVFYAARDAQVSVALFLQLLGFFSSDDSTPWDFILSKCQGLIDVPFKGKGVNGDINIIPRQKKEGLLEQSSTNSQGDPRKNKKKPLGVGYSVRSLLRRYVVPVVPAVEPPAPVLVEGELEYVVEKILDSRISRRKLQYLVKWKGYALHIQRVMDGIIPIPPSTDPLALQLGQGPAYITTPYIDVDLINALNFQASRLSLMIPFEMPG